MCQFLLPSEIPWNRIWHLNLAESRNIDVSIVVKTHINLDQIHHIRNNWLGAIFFSPGDSHTKGLLVLPHLGLEGVTEVDTDPKWTFVSFKITLSSDRFLCVYAPSRHSTREQLAQERFVEGLQNFMENKNEWNESKIYLETLIVLWINWRGLVEIKLFIDVVSVMPCQNSSCIMDWRIYEERRTQIPLSSPATTDLLAQDLG